MVSVCACANPPQLDRAKLYLRRGRVAISESPHVLWLSVFLAYGECSFLLSVLTWYECMYVDCQEETASRMLRASLSLSYHQY